MSKNNNKRTPPPYQPSFVTPPPSNRNLYGASSESSQGTEVLSQKTEVLSNEEDLPPTPHLSQENDAGAASATPGASRLKKTNAPGFRGNRIYTNAEHKYMYRANLNDPSQDFPCDVYGNYVPFTDSRRNASRHVDNVEETIANLSSATPLSRRNVTARAAASAAAEAEDSDQVAASTLFSPAAFAASAVPRASSSSVLSLTPHHRPLRNRNSQNSQNSPRQNNAKHANRNRNKIGGTQRKYKGKTQRKYKGKKQRKQRTRR